MRLRAVLLVAGGCIVLASGGLRAEERPELSLPLACEPHRTCFIQSYVDDDPGPEARDYTCGGATYDKHSGVDFRLLSAAAAKAGVAVLASAGGVVKALRDGVPDKFMREGKAEETKGRECGNGVVLDHGDGWETQYCHMKSGSIAVKKGQTVERGATLGEVGYSGMADFAHVHISVRHDGKTVDPFLPDAPDGRCQRDAKGPGLWQPSVIAAFPYREGEILGTGFAAEPPKWELLETDHMGVTPPGPDSPALIFYARFMNLAAKDRVRFAISGPGGSLVENLSEPLDRHKAIYLGYAGVKRPQDRWMPGRYEARVEIVRDSGVVGAASATLDMP